MPSISEFERIKPKKTYKELDSLIQKYRSISEREDSSEEDVCSSQYIISKMLTREIAKDLLSLKKVFLTGE